VLPACQRLKNAKFIYITPTWR